MYPRKKVEKNKIVAHHAKGEGEITDQTNKLQQTNKSTTINNKQTNQLTPTIPQTNSILVPQRKL